MQCDTRAGGSRHHVARSATCAKARSTDNEACALIMQALHSHSSSDRRSGAPVGSGGGPLPWSNDQPASRAMRSNDPVWFGTLAVWSKTGGTSELKTHVGALPYAMRLAD